MGVQAEFLLYKRKNNIKFVTSKENNGISKKWKHLLSDFVYLEPVF